MDMSSTCSAGLYTQFDENTPLIQICTYFANGRSWLNQLLLWRVHELGCFSTDSVHPFPSSIRVRVQVCGKMHDEIYRDKLTLFCGVRR